MMKLTARIAAIVLIFFTAPGFCLSNNSYSPRLFIWGLAGSDSIGRLDLLQPLAQGCQSLLYTDLQTEAGNDSKWFAGIGAGYRGVFCEHLYGGYLFLDRNESEHQQTFWILNPGFETRSQCWDFRINGYIPVSEKRKDEGSFFLSDPNVCGQNGDCSFVVFQGHQQFEHRFAVFDEVGPGGDLEIGMNVPCSNVWLHGGVYYFHFEDKNNIKGVEGRIEIPLKNYVTLTAEANYDSVQGAAVVAGFRIQLGHTPRSTCPNLCERLYDPVVRNLASTRSGSGVPIIHSKRDEGLFLRRDSIYFVTSQGGVDFSGIDSGTFENPLNAEAFNQATLVAIDSLTPGANFYFNPGTYPLDPSGDGRIELLQDQSIYGRSADYKCSAVGSERAVFVGGFDLFSGGNTLDSFVLNNIVTGPSSVVGIDIVNAENVSLCNTQINVSSTVIGDIIAGGNNEVLGIHAENSSVLLHLGEINIGAIVIGNNLGINSGVGIGGSSSNFTNNLFIVEDSTINVAASVVNLSNGGTNMAIGIGSHQGLADDNLGFTFQDSLLNVNANVAGSISEGSLNSAIGVGSDTSFTNNNNFLIDPSAINVSATALMLDTGANLGVGIGSFSSNFTDNNFVINAGSINSAANIGQDNVTGTNIGIGIGSFLSTNVSNNNFAIRASEINAIALIGGDNSNRNLAACIGNTRTNVSIYSNNVFDITHSFLRSNASVNNDNSSLNEADGITFLASDSNNSATLSQSAVDVLALVAVDNSGNNRAFGLTALGANVIDVSQLELSVLAIVGGVDTGLNQQTPTDGNVIFH